MTTIPEGNLTFKFDDTWNIVIDYDKPGTSDYARYFQNDKVTAVDFVAGKTSTDNKQIVFIEVKNMRGHEARIENVEKFKNDAEILTKTIAKNVRDTFYGIIIGCRKTIASNNSEWKKINETLIDESSNIKVIFWLEADLPVIPTAPSLHSINQKLKNKLSKLTSSVLVSNMDNPVATIEVTST
jgi:hypothetical protein